jgi:hypothetical protein
LAEPLPIHVDTYGTAKDGTDDMLNQITVLNMLYAVTFHVTSRCHTPLVWPSPCPSTWTPTALPTRAPTMRSIQRHRSNVSYLLLFMLHPGVIRHWCG